MSILLEVRRFFNLFNFWTVVYPTDTKLRRCGGGNRNHLVQAYETCKCTSSNFPAMYFVQEAGLAPARFSCLSTNLWRGHVCLSSPLTVWTLSPLLHFLISNMSKNFVSSDCLNLCLLYQNIRSCFRRFWFFEKFFNFSWWTRGVLPPGLAQASDRIIHRLSRFF